MAPRKQKSTKSRRAESAPGRMNMDRDMTEDRDEAGPGEDDEGTYDDGEDGDPGDDDDEGAVLDAEIMAEEDLDENIDEDIDQIITPRRDAKESDAHLALIKRDPLTAYIQETKRFPILDREEEHTLAVRYAEDGDTDAARRLIQANLRLVVKIAYEYRRAHRNLLDLIQEGNMGLMQAVKKYDPYRGVKLSSYAAWWIRAYILKFVLNNWRMVKIGTTQAQRKLFFNLRKEKERLEQLGFAPTTALLAENLEVAEQDVIEMEKRMSAPDASLDAPMGIDDEGGVRTRMDSLMAGKAEEPYRRVAQSEVQELFREKLDAFGQTLEERDRAIFYERLLGDTPLTLQEIGDRYGISRERTRQLEKRLLGKLREYLEAELGTAVDIGAMIRE
jgi:RNA polymerase sigma-32 factor